MSAALEEGKKEELGGEDAFMRATDDNDFMERTNQSQDSELSTSPCIVMTVSYIQPWRLELGTEIEVNANVNIEDYFN